ncbi:Ribosome-associated ATPase [bioreactor metagenome]|uniref:Ribosome-associated ATPase n=1 Tax=bioreactor metagenome TaxID=1076179 RepID=A0A645DMZ1_9ZZZZ
MFKRIIAIIGKETRELLRDPLYLGLALVVPMMIIIIMGEGMTLDVKNIPVAFYDRDRSAASREYVSSFTNSEYFKLFGMLDREGQAEELMARGKIRLCIEIPENFSERLAGNKPVSVRVAVDGSFPSRSEVITGYVGAINQQTNNLLLSRYKSVYGQNVSLPSTELIAISWYNPTLESKNFLVPGLISTILMFYPSLLAALVVVREKEVGTIYNLYCSPVKGWEVVIGKAVPYIAISFVAYLLIFLLSVLFFEVRFTGSFFALTVSALLFLTCTVGYGLLISIIASSQLAAMFITILTTMLPSFFYSGFLAPVTSQSALGQFISAFLPSTYFMYIVRGIYLKGASFAIIWPDLLALLIYAVILYFLAIACFRKKVN